MYTGVTGSFTYGADGLRRSASANGVTTHYVLDGQNVVQEVTGTNRVTTLWGPRGPEARIAPDGTALWYVYDGHGNVLGEVDANGVLNPDSSGNPTAARVFDPWGYVLNWQQVADNGNPLKYCGSLGHPSENATGLIYMRARYYDPALGRFISEDPAKDGGNWFLYAGGNPVANVDPDGREFNLGSTVLSASIAGVVNGAMTQSWTGFFQGFGVGFAGGFGSAAGAAAGFATSAWNVMHSSGPGSSFQKALFSIALGTVGGALGGLEPTKGVKNGIEVLDEVWIQESLFGLLAGEGLGIADMINTSR